MEKAITVSTGMADTRLVNDFEIFEAAPYSISKAPASAVVAYCNAAHRRDGILFLAVSPRLVDTETQDMPALLESEMPREVCEGVF